MLENQNLLTDRVENLMVALSKDYLMDINEVLGAYHVSPTFLEPFQGNNMYQMKDGHDLSTDTLYFTVGQVQAFFRKPDLTIFYRHRKSIFGSLHFFNRRPMQIFE